MDGLPGNLIQPQSQSQKANFISSSCLDFEPRVPSFDSKLSMFCFVSYDFISSLFFAKTG